MFVKSLIFDLCQPLYGWLVLHPANKTAGQFLFWLALPTAVPNAFGRCLRQINSGVGQPQSPLPHFALSIFALRPNAPRSSRARYLPVPPRRQGLVFPLLVTCSWITVILPGFWGALLTQNGLSLTSTSLTPGKPDSAERISPAFWPPTVFLTSASSIIGTAVVSSTSCRAALFGDSWLCTLTLRPFSTLSPLGFCLLESICLLSWLVTTFSRSSFLTVRTL